MNKPRQFGAREPSQYFLQFSLLEWLLEVANDGKTKNLRELSGCLNRAHVSAAHQDNACLVLPLSEEPQQLNTIHLRHHKIQQN